MGLDMFLHTNSKKACVAANKATNGKPWQISDGTAIYWRKANAIHEWFVDNVQYGEDDCGTYEVEVEQLIKLRDTCNKVINASHLVPGKLYAGTQYKNGKEKRLYEDGLVVEDPSVAKELLPTSDGFFFGGTDYDEWYINDLKRTVAGIDAILDNIEQYEYHPFGDEYTRTDWREKGEPDAWSVTFSYHASW